MAFLKIDKSLRGSYTVGVQEVRMGSHLQSARGTTRGIYLSISEAVINQVGWTHNKPDPEMYREICSIDLQEGVGEDAGFLLLVENPDPHKGYQLGTTNKGARSYSMSISLVKMKHYTLNDVPMPAMPVEFTIDAKDQTILIQCPDWLRYDPTSYKEAPKQEVKKPSPPTKAAASVGDAKAIPPTNLPAARKDRRAQVSATTRAMQ